MKFEPDIDRTQLHRDGFVIIEDVFRAGYRKVLHITFCNQEIRGSVQSAEKKILF